MRGRENISRGQNRGRIPLTGGFLLILAETERVPEEAFNTSLTPVPEISSIVFKKFLIRPNAKQAVTLGFSKVLKPPSIHLSKHLLITYVTGFGIVTPLYT